MEKPQDRAQTEAAERPKTKKPYEPPRVVSDEAFEQLSLTCSIKTSKKNFT